MSKSFLSAGIRKYIRARKAEMRRAISDPIQQEKAINDLYSEISFENIKKRKILKRTAQQNS